MVAHDPETRLFIRHGVICRLPPKAYAVAAALHTRPQRVFERNELVDIIDPNMESEAYYRTVDQAVKHARRGMERAFGGCPWIKPCYGTGYYWDDTETLPAPPAIVHGPEDVPIPPAPTRARLFDLWKDK